MTPADTAHTPPPADTVYAPRLDRLRSALNDLGTTHALLTDPMDVAYFTGFLGGDSELIVGPEGPPAIVTDFRYQEELAPLAGALRIVVRPGGMDEAVAAVLAEECAAGRLRRVAVQGEHVTLARRRGLDRALRGVGLRATHLMPTLHLTTRQRMQKDAHEVALIRRAAAIQQEALLETLPTIQPGQTELEVCARLEFEMKRRGSSRPAFETSVAAAEHSALPHYRPGPARLRDGHALLIDWGAVVGGYHSDMTRVFALGAWPAELAEVYDIVLEAHERAAAALAPGVSIRAVDAAARDFIKARGHGERFGHGLGHGIGLRIHEGPRLSHNAPDMPLEPGHVVTVEPGVYVPGLGGVRIEDDYLITPAGAENLCTLPRDRAWATR